MELAAGIVVNAAGLWAPGLAAATHGLGAPHVPQGHHAKGNYFSLAGRAPFSRLVYPVPEQAGLGVHLTLDLAGQARFGPDVEWLAPGSPDDIDYRVDAARADGFYVVSGVPAAVLIVSRCTAPPCRMSAGTSSVRPKSTTCAASGRPTASRARSRRASALASVTQSCASRRSARTGAVSST